MLHAVPSGRRRRRTFAEVTGVSYPQELLPFVIPDLSRDLEGGMFITMALARRSGEPFVREIYDLSRDYFQRLQFYLNRARLGDDLARRKARRMAAFPEVAELGFGYTTESRNGRGPGSGKVCDLIYNTLLEYPGLAQACAEEPDLISFVPGVGLDRVGDTIGTIAKAPLIRYTQEQARLHRFTPSCMKSVPLRNVWDNTAERLITVTAEVPVADDGRPILLVRKNIVRSSPPVRPEQYRLYYGLAGLSTDQLKRRILEENRHNGAALLALARQIFEDEWRFRARRGFRD